MGIEKKEGGREGRQEGGKAGSPRHGGPCCSESVPMVKASKSLAAHRSLVTPPRLHPLPSNFLSPSFLRVFPHECL